MVIINLNFNLVKLSFIGEFKPLSGNVSLKQIASEKYGGFDKFKKLSTPLELFYAYRLP